MPVSLRSICIKRRDFKIHGSLYVARACQLQLHCTIVWLYMQKRGANYGERVSGHLSQQKQCQCEKFSLSSSLLIGVPECYSQGLNEVIDSAVICCVV